jgi:hypothetical protein
MAQKLHIKDAIIDPHVILDVDQNYHAERRVKGTMMSRSSDTDVSRPHTVMVVSPSLRYSRLENSMFLWDGNEIVVPTAERWNHAQRVEHYRRTRGTLKRKSPRAGRILSKRGRDRTT